MMGHTARFHRDIGLIGRWGLKVTWPEAGFVVDIKSNKEEGSTSLDKTQSRPNSTNDMEQASLDSEFGEEMFASVGLKSDEDAAATLDPESGEEMIYMKEPLEQFDE